MKILFAILTIVSFVTFGQVPPPEFDNSLTITPQGLKGGGYTWMSKKNLAIGYGVASKIWGEDNIILGLDSASLFYTGRGGGSGNILIGRRVLTFVNSASNNVAIGVGAGSFLHYGTGNIFIGYGANMNNFNRNTYNGVIVIGSGAWSNEESSVVIGSGAKAYGKNSVAIGTGAIADSFGGNKVRIGNDQITSIEGQVPWSTPSDRRLKENIVYTSRLGLDFINRLKPASYNYIADGTKVRRDGFIAQDVEKIMKELGVEFSGLQKAQDNTYSLAYSDFVMPLVNAVKEQQKQIEDLKKEVTGLRELKKQVEALLKIADK